MVGINDKSASNTILNSLTKSLNKQTRIIKTLASGINDRLQNPAGFAIVDAGEVRVKSYQVASRNANDGISAVNIADGALGELEGIAVRQRELALQASNGVLSDDQRATLNAEFQELSAEAARITETTEFNGTKLLQGDSIDLQVGIDSSENSIISTGNISVDTSGISGADISTQAGAQAALGTVDSFSVSNTQLRGKLGSVQNRLGVTISNISTQIVNTEDSISKIRDADVAKETANFTKYQILSQQGVALQAQANISARTALQLLG